VDQAKIYADTLVRMQHRDSAGWHPMNEVSDVHDTAGSDPERRWLSRRIFRCDKCSEEIMVEVPMAGTG